MRFLLYILLAMAAAWGFSSCISDDVTSSPSARLEFSTDTVSFDTIFTDVGSTTARLRVFNRNKKGVVISSIRLRNPDSPFSLNVDGVSGDQFSNIEIRGGDSIFIFIECFLPESQADKPYEVTDELIFALNGNEQTVTIEAFGQNVTRLNGVTFDSDMTLTADRPYVVFDSLTVAPGATLRIEPGARILFHDNAKLTVEGTIDARGLPGKMIQLRGDRLDNVLPDVGYDILAGQWHGVRIAAGSFDNHLEYVDMRSTVSGLTIDSTANTDRQKLTLVNSWLHNSQGTVIDSRYAKVDAYGCVFSEAADAVVSLTGGSHLFSQCTIANYYLFSVVSRPLLSLYHLLPDDAYDNPLPLMHADFNNCIIYGLASDINCGDLTGADVFLRYTLLKSEGSDDNNFIHCLWGEDPLFETIREDYYFNYELKEGSPAIDAGDPALTAEPTLYDMNGVYRLSAGRPTLGAYAR